jgi:hypothetical protein
MYVECALALGAKLSNSAHSCHLPLSHLGDEGMIQTTCISGLILFGFHQLLLLYFAQIFVMSNKTQQHVFTYMLAPLEPMVEDLYVMNKAFCAHAFLNLTLAMLCFIQAVVFKEG